MELLGLLADLIDVDVLQRASNARLSSITLPPSESFEVRVVLRAKPSAPYEPGFVMLAKKGLISESLDGARSLMLGSIIISAESLPDEVINLHSRFVQGATFSVSAQQLNFHVSTQNVQEAALVSSEARADSFRLKSLSILPLEFDITLQHLPESVRRLFNIDPPRGIVDAGGSIEVSVSLVTSTTAALSAVLAECTNVALHVTDMKCATARPSIILLSIAFSGPRGPKELASLTRQPQSMPETPVELTSEPTSGGYITAVAEATNDVEDPAFAERPIIQLRGCPNIPGAHRRFEMNRGAIEWRSDRACIDWVIQLENSSGLPARFKITVLGVDKKEARSWLALSHRDGLLEHRHDSSAVTVTMSTELIGSYYSYLIIETSENPEDTKSIRVGLEVVAVPTAPPAVRQSYYSVYTEVEGLNESELLIDYGMVYCGTLYRERSFTISNHFHLPLDFILTSNVGHANKARACELVLSTCSTSLRRFNALIVPPKSSVPVYIFLRPQIDAAEKHDTDAASCGEPVHLELYVTCRLVKDHQEVVHVRYTMWMPQIALSLLKESESFGSFQRTDVTEVIFYGKDVPSGTKAGSTELVFSPEWQLLEIFNTQASPLRYIIRNDSLFFTVEAPTDAADGRETVVAPGQSQTIRIRINMKHVQENKALVLKNKYIEEHLSVYNQRQLSESYALSAWRAHMHARAVTRVVTLARKRTHIRTGTSYRSGYRWARSRTSPSPCLGRSTTHSLTRCSRGGLCATSATRVISSSRRLL
jgi:hypothetical protein